MKRSIIFFIGITLFCNASIQAQNPFIMDQFTADPTARVFEGKIYVYPSHDINCGTNWFCMQDYHVFSSENLVDWTDHGVIVHQDDVDWVDASTNTMWAPDCYEKNGKYYFYFPAIADSTKGVKGRSIGVAVSDKPYGPFVPEKKPIEGVRGIDPNVYIDHDGQAYLYWAAHSVLVGARLADNMLELASEPQVIETLPGGFKEGPFLFERNGIYYFTFPRVIEHTEALVYATGDNPMGPFEYQGIIMDEHPSRCWTNHHSIVEYENQWYLFYHHNDLSPDFDKNRSIRVDSLFFNGDGTIQKVTPTLRGVGLTNAANKIQIDRYSGISSKGASIAFLDTTDTFKGWKTVLSSRKAGVSYNSVDFGKGDFKTLKARSLSEKGGTIELTTGNGNTITIEIPSSREWQIVTKDLSNMPSGIQNIHIRLKDGGQVQIDWIRFE